MAAPVAFCVVLAELVQQQRKRRKLSLTELAGLAGLTRQAVAFLETNRRKPRMDTMVRLCGVFGVRVSRLFILTEARLF